MTPIKHIKFSQNWNGKLNCHFYTTIRLSNINYYRTNEVYQVLMNETFLHDAIIISVATTKIYDISNLSYLLDTGYQKQQAIEMLQRMYSNKNVDWNTQQLDVILLENLNYKP